MKPVALYCLFMLPETAIVLGLLWLAAFLDWVQPFTAMLLFIAWLLLLALLYPLFRLALRPASPIGARAFVGEQTPLLGAAAPVGHVRLNGEIWLARSSDGRPILAGRLVRVVDAEGLELVVELASTDCAPMKDGQAGG